MRRTIAIAVLVLLAAPARGHERSASWSSWVVEEGGALVVVRLTALEATRLPPGEEPGAYLARHLRLLAGDELCRPVAPPRALATPPDQRAWEWRVACAAPGPLRIESAVLLDVAPSILHFARVRRTDGRMAERVLSDRERAWPLDGPPAPSLAAAVGLGVAHILSGWDHLAFVVALLLVGGSLGEVARIVTGFTVAHSATLALAALGWVRPGQARVEALIGLSIALVAAENLWLAGRRGPGLPAALGAGLLALAALAAAGTGAVPPLVLVGLALFTVCHLARLARSDRPLRLRWSAAFAFGLVHGFGFASVLVDAGLPTAALARLLVGFNAGVELGQLALVAAVLPLVVRMGRRRPVVLEVGSAALAGLGVFWFVTRAFGA